MSDEAELQRLRDDDGPGDRTPTPSELGGSTIVVQTKTVGTYPTAAARFFACDVIGVFGPETEGATATYWPKTETLYCVNLGTAVPPTGTREIADYVPHRWVFRH